MLRFIIKSKCKRLNGLETEILFTEDIDVPDLERILTAGGSGYETYERIELVGVEIIEPLESEEKEK